MATIVQTPNGTVVTHEPRSAKTRASQRAVIEHVVSRRDANQVFDRTPTSVTIRAPFAPAGEPKGSFEWAISTERAAGWTTVTAGFTFRADPGVDINAKHPFSLHTLLTAIDLPEAYVGHITEALAQRELD